MKMRAKMKVSMVMPYPDEPVTVERLMLHCVARSGSYPNDGMDEDNTFAKFSPSGVLDIQIANPALIGQFKVGDVFYVDFTPTEPSGS